MKPCCAPPADTPAEKLDNDLHKFLHTHRNTLCRYFQSCGLSSGHPRLLFFLHHEPGLTQKALADAMDIAAPTLSVSIRRMEAAGLVERRADDKDARVQRLYLTAEGEAMQHRCEQGREFLIAAQFADFSDEDIAVLSRLLGRMTSNLEAAAETLPPVNRKEEHP
ncbi:MAG: winged helix-turn-helix transcriptional regulator [Clostridia bacterium]|nr:winged helix-turn-helix transcriptional regulator [Clostridia bacterium]